MPHNAILSGIAMRRHCEFVNPASSEASNSAFDIFRLRRFTAAYARVPAPVPDTPGNDAGADMPVLLPEHNSYLTRIHFRLLFTCERN
jgi:hypothetical protein